MMIGHRNMAPRTIDLAALFIMQLTFMLANQASADKFEGEGQMFLRQLSRDDKCGSVFTPTAHGYRVQPFNVQTRDNYVLQLHRIIHPADFQSNGPPVGSKKPYILLHGLVATSASYVTNVERGYMAPMETFNANDFVFETFKSKSKQYEFSWSPQAERFQDELFYEKDVRKSGKSNVAYVSELDLDGDESSFARDYKQAYRKYFLPKQAKDYITNSLALTLSNLGYDVWLINLRGNSYSKTLNGRGSASDAEYWDFDIDTLIKEDLLATINFVSKTTRFPGPMGFVSFSYSSAHIMGLLAKFPAYQDILQPVVLMAPSLMTGVAGRSVLHHAISFVTKTLMESHGPFPALGRQKRDKIESLICHLPLVSKLCGLMETILYGKPKSIRSLVFDDRQTALIRRDSGCGQTSKSVLHQLFSNLASRDVHPKFSPYLAARDKAEKGKASRRSIMLVHSTHDQVSTMEDVKDLKEFPLRMLTLVDYVINVKQFGHQDFQFGNNNRHLVNAEIARMVTLFDFMITYPPK